MALYYSLGQTRRKLEAKNKDKKKRFKSLEATNIELSV